MFQTLSFCFRIGGPPPLIVEILWFGYIVLANLITKSRCGLLTEKWAKSSFLLINVVKSVGNQLVTQSGEFCLRSSSENLLVCHRNSQ